MSTGVVDFEQGLAGVAAAADGAADHLFVKDARTHPAQEHQVADGGHVDAGGEQIHGDGDRGVTLEWRQVKRNSVIFQLVRMAPD